MWPVTQGREGKGKGEGKGEGEELDSVPRQWGTSGRQACGRWSAVPPTAGALSGRRHVATVPAAIGWEDLWLQDCAPS